MKNINMSYLELAKQFKHLSNGKQIAHILLKNAKKKGQLLA